ncbi:hypothetical protein ACIBQ1_51655 [Nonomuraea sp. NPDC050153]|uniref:hypothetical protein n=1 Tax=Nonomuraea sp. NPDC050153 TaxID=3364359 RepID=UPI0037B93994
MAGTKRTEDENPVLMAEQALADAQKTAADAQRRLDDLKQTLIDHGHQAVTAEQLGAATHELEHAKLGVTSAELALKGAHRAARLRMLEALAEEITHDAGQHPEVTAAFNKMTEGAAELLAIAERRYVHLHRWIGALQAAGVPRLDKYDKARQLPDGTITTPYNHVTEEHAYLGWEIKDGPWNQNAVTVADRRIVDHGHGLLLAAAVKRACQQAGVNPKFFEDQLDVTLGANFDPLVTNPEQWIAAHY